MGVHVMLTRSCRQSIHTHKMKINQKILREIGGTLLFLGFFPLTFLSIFTQSICEIGSLTSGLKTNTSDAGVREHVGLGGQNLKI